MPPRARTHPPDLDAVTAALALSERRVRWLTAAAELTVALQPPLDHEVALMRIARAVLPLTRACAVAAGTISARGTTAAIAALPAHDDAAADRVFRELPAALPGGLHGPTRLEIGGYHLLVVPLRSALAGRGAVAAFHTDRASLPDPDEEDLFAGFGQQAGLALDRVQAVDDRADLAVMIDRERIARDLHDVVIQRLFATGLQLQALGQLTADPVLAERLGAAVDALDLTVKDVRGTIFALHNHDPGSLRDELREVVREYVGGLGFTPAVRTTGPVDTVVPDAVRVQLIPVLREAISNLARHANASAAEIEIAVGDEELVLVVRDNGIGLPKDGIVESGLRNVRGRATQLGGSFALHRRPSGGTAFRWAVPLTAG